MKVIFTLLILLSFENLIGQSNSIVIGNREFKAILIQNGLTIYSAPCEANSNDQFASRSVIRYDSIKRIGYLNSYNYVNDFVCQDIVGHSVLEQIKGLLAEQKDDGYEFGILFGMEDNNHEFIGSLSLFKKKKFEKFIKKANRVAKRTFSGEVMVVREYNYSKYSKEFILAKTNDTLSLIEVR